VSRQSIRGTRALLFVSAALAIAPAPAGAADPEAGAAPSPAADSIRGRVIVQWRQGADHADKVAARESAEVDFEAQLGAPSFQLVEVEPGQSAADAARELEADPAVAVAEPDGYRTLDSVPNDPLFSQLWGLRNTGAGVHGFAGAVAGADVNAVAAWDRSVGVPTTVVADIDSGYRFDDPDLGPVAWTNPGEVAGNGIDDDANGYVDDVHGYDFVGTSATTPSEDADPTDDNVTSGGHGLHTAGTIGAAGNDGVGITGVARNARIMPLRVCSNQPSTNETRCPFSSILAAINYAGEMGARAANLSLGGTTFTQTEVNAIAAHPETLYVISAGNDGGNNDGGEAAPKGHHYPCDYRPTVDAAPAVPGAIDNVLCVAATDQADALASYSDYGATSVDLGAPGSAVLSTYPTIDSWMTDDFEVDDYAGSWLPFGAAGFGRAGVGDGPLTSFGINDTPGATPEANHVYGVESATETALPAGTGSCRIKGMRHRKGGAMPYGLFLDGSFAGAREFLSGETAGSAMVFFQTVPILGLGGHTLKMFFEYQADSTPLATEGAWLDDLRLECYAPVSTPLTHSFLDGTSMAAPHVTGAAALLFSLKPSATVTEVRNALLGSVHPTASLAGKTTTGGRLDIVAALKALVPVGQETVPPETELLSQPPAETASTSAGFQLHRTDADGGGFQCNLDGGGWNTCSSVPSFVVGVGKHKLEARATDPGGLVDPTPVSASWTVTGSPPGEEQGPPTGGGPTVRAIIPLENTSPPPTPKTCKVPALAGKTLAQAKSALAAAGCTLGTVAKPKPKKGRKPPKLVVKSSTPGAGSSTSGAVNLKLGPKPKKRHH
jgi:subtilisin family serine protease